MKAIKRFTLFSFLVFATLPSAAQETETEVAPIDLLIERLDEHQRLQPQEKLYLHLEKEKHKNGEHLWFKVYLVAGARHRPSPISTGANIEVIGPDGQVLKKLYVKVNRGMGYGDLAITRDMPKGVYRIKAYTDWMKNFDFDYIPVTKVAINQDEPISPVNGNDCEVDFVPEGGTWVAELKQRIAFQSANGKAIEGTITDKDGNTEAELTSNDQGLGMFSIEAAADQSYFANITGCDAPIALPKARPTGTVMTARKMGDQFLRLDIVTNREEDGSLLHAVISARGIVESQLSVEVNGDRARAIVPLKDLPAGISQISIFNEQLALLSERLVFIDSNENLGLETSLAPEKKEGWHTLDATMTDANDSPISGHFSVAVYSEEPKTKPNNIVNFMALQAEIPSIKNPSAYFDTETGKSTSDLDILLMTKKWSWITWKNLKLNRLTPVDKSLNTYMNDAYIERQQFEEDEEAIEGLDANARRLDDVVVTAKREEVTENQPVKKIYGKGDGGSVDFDKIQINNNERVIDILRGRIGGVYVSGNDYETTIIIRGSLTGSGGEELRRLEALVLLNNIPTDVASVLDIPAGQVKSIEVYKGSQASIFGLRGAGGAVAIYTRNEALPDPGAVARSEEEPEEEVKEYAQPAKFEPRPVADNNGMLHWSPLLVTDDEGRISFSFKKPGGLSGPVYLRLQGISRAGIPYSVVKKVE